MAISKNSSRIQFTLNSNKPAEKIIVDFLDGCIDPNAKIKEILYNYIVTESYSPLLKVSNFERSEESESDKQLLTFTKGDEQLLDLSKFNNEEIYKIDSENKENIELSELMNFVRG